jgi:hypothetical protein
MMSPRSRLREASTDGIEAMDALHIAAAASVGAFELDHDGEAFSVDSSDEGRQGCHDPPRGLEVLATDETAGVLTRRREKSWLVELIGIKSTTS